MSKYGIFIIESLRAQDFFDGETLSEILKLSKISVEYCWADSKQDFIRHLDAFRNSEFRYLHLSCHADREGITINGEDMSNAELQNLLKSAIANRRVFVSACEAANKDLAGKIISSGAYSLIGSPVNLHFDKSAMFWPAFYHVMNDIDSTKMNKKNIMETLQRCVDLFKIPINYYSHIKGDRNHLRRLKIRYDGKSNSRKIRVSPR